VWIRLDDGLVDHPKILAATEALKSRDRPSARAVAKSRVIGTFVIALSYANRHLTDGLVPLWIFRGLERERQALVDAHLLTLDKVRQKIGICSYLEYNPKKAEVMAKRAQDLARNRGDRIVHSMNGPAPSPPVPPPPQLPHPTRTRSPRLRRGTHAHVEKSLPKNRASRTFAQLCVIAKGVLHETPDADEGDLREALKAQASKAHLRYDGRTVAKALDAVRTARRGHEKNEQTSRERRP
jgi:hypothetical protein